MNHPDDAVRLIAAAGGDTEFARLIGIDHEPGFQQRVNNWKRRGIPPGVILDHYDELQALKMKADSPAACPQQA